MELMTVEDLQRFSMDGNTFFKRVDTFPKIINLEAFYAWLDEHGERSIVKETIHSKTLQAWYKDVGLEFEEELKNGLLEVFEKMTVGLRTDSK